MYNQAARGKGKRGAGGLAPLKNNGAASEAELRLLKQKMASDDVTSYGRGGPPKAKSADQLIQSLSQRRLREEAQQEELRKSHADADMRKKGAKGKGGRRRGTVRTWTASVGKGALTTMETHRSQYGGTSHVTRPRNVFILLTGAVEGRLSDLIRAATSEWQRGASSGEERSDKQ